MVVALFFGSAGTLLMITGFSEGGWHFLESWCGLSLLLVGIAYLAKRPRLLGKRDDGTRCWWAPFVLGPYLLLTTAVWRGLRLAGNAPCWHEFAPGRYVGRRAFAHELPDSIDLVVDLTAEFAEPAAVRTGRTYRCVPTLDSTAPAEETFAALVRDIATWPGSVYIHCAEGRGRSATVAVAVMIHQGLADEVSQAEAMLRNLRPTVRLNAMQKAMVERVVRRLRSTTSTTTPASAGSATAPAAEGE